MRRLLTKLQSCFHEKVELDDNMVDLQKLTDCYLHLKNLANQAYNMIEVQLIRGKDSFEVNRSFQFMKPEDRTAPWDLISKTRWALSSCLAGKQAANFVTTSAPIADYELRHQLSKCWDFESYTSHRDVNSQSKDNQ